MGTKGGSRHKHDKSTPAGSLFRISADRTGLAGLPPKAKLPLEGVERRCHRIRVLSSIDKAVS